MTIARILALSIVAMAGCATAAAEGDDADSGRLGADDTEDDDDVSSSSSSSSGRAATSSSSSGGVDQPIFDAPAQLAEGVTIQRVWAMQSVAVPLAEDGQALATDVPFVAGRDLWIRVFLAASSAARDVRLEVLVEPASGAPQIFSTAWTLQPAQSIQVAAGSTPIVHVPAAAIDAGTRWSVRVVEADAPAVDLGTQHAARYPLDGTRLALGAHDVAKPQVVIVPLRWDADDSHRLPDTSPAAMDALRTQLLAWYPIHDVDLTVHDAVSYTKPIGGDGDVDFYDVNDVLYALRGAEAPAPNVYYYGLLAPAASFDDYCTNVCTTGQSYTVTNVADADIRVGAGVAFTQEGAANTFAHELGHLFGRGHSPCNVQSWDPDYPYAHGLIGSWGWGSSTLHDPAVDTDFMGYCDDQWVSDYTYRGLFDRMVALQGANTLLPAISHARIRLVHVSGSGVVTLGRSVNGVTRARGATATVRWIDANGRSLGTQTVRAERIGRDGTTLFVPEVAGGVRVEVL
jgi:hypothetical protein